MAESQAISLRIAWARHVVYDVMPMVTTTVPVRQRWESLLAALPASMEMDVLERAFRDVEELYADRRHWSGMSLLNHCLDLLEELARFKPDNDTALVCLLHHVPELQLWNFDEIERRYGQRVRAMVGELHVLQHLTTHNRRVSVERLRLNFFRVSKDVRVFLLIFCHHMLTMHEMHRLPAEEQRRICTDALQLYAPAAARLGIYSLKHAFEDAGFPVLYPVDHERIIEQVQAVSEKYGSFLEDAGAAIMRTLREQGVEAVVEGREKHPYSIFLKMRRKTVNHIDEIPDLFALRVVVADEASCYQALGCLHRLGYPVQNRFKDYIAFPKPNGYQSLHTTLLGLPHMPQGMMAEVQIRTVAMHHEADIGVAAHWRYKEGEQRERHRMLVERAFLPEGDEEHPRRAGMVDHMFVLTPRGDVVELPEGATPLDFAFHVHTAVGLSFKAARVNGVIVALDHALENGDIVEILRHRDAKPSPRWMSLLKTASARNRLKRHLAVAHRPQLFDDGKRAFNAELQRLRLPPLDAQYTLLRMLDGTPTTLLEREDFLVAIGQGSLSMSAALARVDALMVHRPDVRSVKSNHRTPRVPRVEGSIPMPVLLAKCCKPTEQKHREIIGVIGRSGDVRIHRRGCSMLRMANPERLIPAHWTEPTKAARK